MDDVAYGWSLWGGDGGFPHRRPTRVAQAKALAWARANKEDPRRDLISPSSRPAGSRGTHYAIKRSPTATARMRRVYGLSAARSDTKRLGAETPLLCAIVLISPSIFAWGSQKCVISVGLRTPTYGCALLHVVISFSRIRKCAPSGWAIRCVACPNV